MKTPLPNQPHLFEKAVTAAIETVRSSQIGISFLAHLVSLIQALREHPITTHWIKELEEENQKRKEAFNVKAIEAVEAEWMFLWKKYPGMACRKELVRIQHLLTKNNDISSQLPFDRACFSFLEFKTKFECDACSKKFSEFFEHNQHLRVSRDKNIYTQYIQATVELDPVYFWDRLCLLERIHQFSSHKFQVNQSPIQGKWSETKYLYWERTASSSLQMVLWQAQKNLWARFDGDGFTNEMRESSWPIDVACKFSRTACEGYLDRLLINLHPILLSVESNNHNSMPPSQAVGIKPVPQQKADELEKHTRDYWEKHPKAIYDEVYRYYCSRCRFRKPYSFSEWERKVRDLKLDPRPPSEKVRGFSKKGR